MNSFNIIRSIIYNARYKKKKIVSFKLKGSENVKYSSQGVKRETGSDRFRQVHQEECCGCDDDCVLSS